MVKKKVAHKKTVVRKSTSKKALLHQSLPIRWSFFSISIMTVLAALAVVFPQTGVLGDSTGPVNVSVSTVMKNGSSVSLSGSQGFLFKVTQTTEVKHKKTTKTVASVTLTSLPSVQVFSASTSGSYTVTLTALSGTQYTVLNGRRVINVKNGKTECKVSNKTNPCTFFVVSGVRNTGDLGDKEGTGPAALKIRTVQTTHPRPTPPPHH